MADDEKAAARLQNYLGNLAKNAFDEYKIISVDIPSRQAGYLKTYLWLASVLIAAELSFYSNILSQNFPRIDFLYRFPNLAFYIAAATSLGCAVIVFAFGVDTLRGRKQHSIALGDLMQVVELAKGSAISNDNSYYVPVIRAYNDAISHQATACHQIGVKLRRMSRLILLSLLLAICSILAVSTGRPVPPAESSQPRQKEVTRLDRGKQEAVGHPAGSTPDILGGYPDQAGHDLGKQCRL